MIWGKYFVNTQRIKVWSKYFADIQFTKVWGKYFHEIKISESMWRMHEYFICDGDENVFDSIYRNNWAKLSIRSKNTCSELLA